MQIIDIERGGSIKSTYRRSCARKYFTSVVWIYYQASASEIFVLQRYQGRRPDLTTVSYLKPVRQVLDVSDKLAFRVAGVLDASVGHLYASFVPYAQSEANRKHIPSRI